MYVNLGCLFAPFSCRSTVLGQAPVHVLRPILYRLSLKGVLDAVWPEVLQLLPLADDELQECHLPSWTGHVDHDIHKSFQRSIAIDLYGWDTFRSLRFRMAIAVFCWVIEFLVPLLTHFLTVNISQFDIEINKWRRTRAIWTSGSISFAQSLASLLENTREAFVVCCGLIDRLVVCIL